MSEQELPINIDKDADNTSQNQMISDNEYSEDVSSSLPLDVHIGFYSNVTKKQVRKHVIAYAEKNFSSLNDVTYQIVRHEDGFLYELQQGGEGLGYISDYLENDYDDALIITSSKVYRASSSIHGGIRLIKLTDEDVKEVTKNPDNFNILENKDSLRSLKIKGFGFFIFASILLLASVLSVGLSAGIKYVVLDKEEAIFFTNQNKTFPHEFITEMQNEMYQMDLSSEFFKNFVYDSSASGEKKWSIERGTILNQGSSLAIDDTDDQQFEGDE